MYRKQISFDHPHTGTVTCSRDVTVRAAVEMYSAANLYNTELRRAAVSSLTKATGGNAGPYV